MIKEHPKSNTQKKKSMEMILFKNTWERPWQSTE